MEEDATLSMAQALGIELGEGPVRNTQEVKPRSLILGRLAQRTKAQEATGAASTAAALRIATGGLSGPISHIVALIMLRDFGCPVLKAAVDSSWEAVTGRWTPSLERRRHALMSATSEILWRKNTLSPVRSQPLRSDVPIYFVLGALYEHVFQQRGSPSRETCALRRLVGTVWGMNIGAQRQGECLGLLARFEDVPAFCAIAERGSVALDLRAYAALWNQPRELPGDNQRWVQAVWGLSGASIPLWVQAQELAACLEWTRLSWGQAPELLAPGESLKGRLLREHVEQQRARLQKRFPGWCLAP